MRAAAITVQHAWRRSWGLRIIRKLLAEKYERVLDPASKKHFYFNKVTQESTWKKPMGKIVGDDWDVPLAKDLQDQKNGYVHVPGRSHQSCGLALRMGRTSACK